MKKYEFAGETKFLGGKAIYRIRSLRDFADVKKGDLGGFVESEKNLDHYGDCWVYEDAKVCGYSTVINDATVRGISIIEDSHLRNNCRIYDSKIEKSFVLQNAIIRNSRITDSVVSRFAIIENGIVTGNSLITDKAQVVRAFINDATINGDAEINNNFDYYVFHYPSSNEQKITYTFSNEKWCITNIYGEIDFYGDKESFLREATKDASGITAKCYEAYVKLVESLNKIRKDVLE